MKVRIKPSKITGVIEAPQSKSYAIRYIMSSIIAPIELYNLVLSQDVSAAIEAVKALNMKLEVEDGGIKLYRDGQVKIIKDYLYLGGSATTLRMFIPIAAVIGGRITIDGDHTLRRRPIDAVITALESKGIKFSSRYLPITIDGVLRDTYIELPGYESSQHVSGFMIAFAIAGGGTIKIIPPLVSKSYVYLTSWVLKQIGVDVRIGYNRIDIEVIEKPRGYRGRVPGDYLLASFYVASALLTGGKIAVHNLPQPSNEFGDHIVVSLYRDMGAYSEYSNGYWYAEASQSYKAIDVDVEDSPDLALSVTTLASVAEGVTKIRNTERLRIKESNRITETMNMLSKFGIESYYMNNIMYIIGGRPRSTDIMCPDDHRIAMTAATIALRAGGSIDKAECINKSNPMFWHDLAKLGGNISFER